MRLSELLALTWADVDFQARLVRVRAQLSRAAWGAPPGGSRPRGAPRSATSRSPPNSPPSSPANEAAPASLATTTTSSQPAGHTTRATKRRPHRPRPRGQTHRPRRTRPPTASLPRPAPHLRQPPDRRPAPPRLQVSRILGHARTAITLDVYTHLFERATPPTSAPRWPAAEATASEPWRTEDTAIRARMRRAPGSRRPIVPRRIRCQTRERRAT
jgi:integrase